MFATSRLSLIWAASALMGCIPPLIFDDDAGCTDAERCDRTGDAIVPSAPDTGATDIGAEPSLDAAASEAAVEADTLDATPVCPAGQERCGTQCVALRSDPTNCGACGRLCSVPGAASTCVDGACVMTTCAAGLGDCDRDPSNGCETNLGTSTSHCGRCANTCAFAGARAVCAGGACLLDACDADRANCDADASNGCETYTGRSAMHCGRCGVACASGVCVDGTCVPEQRSCAAPTTPGCGLVNLPGGTFSIGSNATCAPGMKTPTCAIYGAPEVADVRVSPFTVDAYEVTVARYRAFLAVRAGEIDRIRSRPIAYPGGIFVPWAGASTEPVSAAIVPTCNWSETIIGREAHPINCIGWWAAQEFCAWDGGRLPTEAEWEYAARGRVVPESGLVAGRIYPWGNQAPMTGAMLASCDRALLAPCPGEDGAVTRRVGRFAAAAGVYDIAGNVAEWLADTYNATSFRSVCWPSRVDPICTMRADLQLIAGGAWVNGEVNLRAASRVAFSPALPLNSVGFRCVRSR